MEQYFKPYPVCRWAQPAMEAAMQLAREAQIAADDIASVEVFSFHEAVRLAARTPETTEQAQYSLPFPVAAALVHGRIGAAEISGEGLRHPLVLRLARSMRLTREPDYDARFPAQRWARIVATLRDGRQLSSDPAVARGSAENPLSDDELASKFMSCTACIPGAEKSRKLFRLAEALPHSGLDELFDQLFARAT
jgi:2-methylcitrate dehydratase PrpD